MKTPLLLLGICAGGMATAQTINLSDTLSTGDVMTYFVLDSNATAYPDVTGADVTWDYSTIGGYGLPANVNEVIDRADSDYSSDFPDANYNEDFENSVLSFFSNDEVASEVVTHGFVFEEISSDYIIKYNIDPLISMKLPLVQGETYTDAMEGEAIVGEFATVPIEGSATITADGSGTLIVGENIYDNVIRVHTEEFSEGEVFGASSSITRESYMYYDPTTSNFPIFVHARILIELSIGGDIGYTTVYSQDEITELVGIEKNEEKLNLSVYPNPVTGNSATINSDQATESITVFSSLGQVMLTIQNPKTTEQIDLSNFANGVYFVQAVKGSATKTEKFIVK